MSKKEIKKLIEKYRINIKNLRTNRDLNKDVNPQISGEMDSIQRTLSDVVFDLEELLK